ncbi:multidrug ABC transporter ATP-binding protein [Paractinoplanes abujensis]|uniref:ABC-2 type transport system ATP-binding protein n=1 Tax=Paractinoplanes abujensis TaxID=882441 RepID=A0A7W7CMH1_9ACTN|nr:ABC transporter ATP-binding protein [Actinoplanes abujensis]MBB4691228.1 ABC-2 type transport system ATP-binding protein [Actinoplanes abujensis]GID17355.1 multidrug ABC transporter ATP-binding protein [Actinoplanes abujensis]
MSTTPVIEVERLNLTYGDFHAVKDLSFEVRPGELYALLGTNGAGKTSTLETIEGHRTPTSGTVRVFGHSPADRQAVRPRMGIMLQESGFSPELTVRESVGLIGKLTRRTDDVDRVIDIVDLTRKAGTQVGQLSGGEKRRLDFATAVYGTPELIFLDEPTTGLDIQSRDHLWNAVDRLRENGSTVVLTTHYLEEAQQRADRIGLMHQGVFHRQGTVTELTRALPAVIKFTLTAPAPALPLQATVAADGSARIETFNLQKDLHLLLAWAQDNALELGELSAGPTRLDDVFRAIES